MFSDKRQFGNKGEDFATMFLVKQGFYILERNYLKKFGEIDLICLKDNVIHFVEVKTVTRETVRVGDNGVISETPENNKHRAEDNVTEKKFRKIAKVAECYIAENSLYKYDLQIDLVTVEFREGEVYPTVKYIPNLIF